jgi:two-component sensor histidine kinase
MTSSPVSTTLPIDTSTDCIKVVGVDGRLLSMNPDGVCLMEIEDFSALEGAMWSSLWPQHHRATLDEAVAKAVSGTVARFSADCPTAKGTPKHWDVMVSPVYGRDGDLTNLLAISRDVTRDVLIAGERALVARELSHRIANLFAVVDGIIRLSARSSPAVKPFAKTLRDRISGLARAVDYIYSGNVTSGTDEAATMHGLLRDLLAPYGVNTSSSGISIVGDDQPIPEVVVTPLALIFNELATNALKYGALSHADGKVQVQTAREGVDYMIVWDETGDPIVEPAVSGGFGATLLNRTVDVQLGGSVKREWKPNGLRLVITLPVVSLV